MKFDNTPVHPEKIILIQELLNDPRVYELYTIFVNLNRLSPAQNEKMIKARNDAFDAYAEVRDEFLGLPPLKIIPMQGTQERFK